MRHRFIIVLVVAGLAGALSGCATNKDTEEIVMPLQTGSRIGRTVIVPAKHEKKAEKKDEKKKEEKKKAPKPEAEPSATPAPEEESTPPPADRFR